MQTLDDAAIKRRLEDLADWSEMNGSLQRTYQFKNFVEAMAFVNTVADLAEKAQHHPDILIRYGKVTLTLSTHDAGGITEKDFDLAAQADGAFG
ncbi:MAG: 4a-hydroxytetrahydrobiopterin dehydratase [Phycisphaerales bacterium]